MPAVVTGDIQQSLGFRPWSIRPIKLILLILNLAYCCDRWNPAVEQQAQDRIHRLGQYKPIHVTRFVIAGSIEERILKLQV